MLHTDLIAVNGFRIEGAWLVRWKDRLKRRRSRNAEVVATRTEAPRIIPIDLRRIGWSVLEANLGCPVRPTVRIREPIVLCRDVGIGADRRAGPINDRTLRTWANIGNPGILLLICISQAQNTGQLIGQGIVYLSENAVHSMVLISATIESERA